MNLPRLAPLSVAVCAATLMGIGFWLMVSPWILPSPYPVGAMVSDELSGVALVLLAIVQTILWGSTAPSWLSTAVALWVMFSPWICGQANDSVPLRNDTAVGVLAVLGASAMLIVTFALQEVDRAKLAQK